MAFVKKRVFGSFTPLCAARRIADPAEEPVSTEVKTASDSKLISQSWLAAFRPGP
jgi:hypothetical protein